MSNSRTDVATKLLLTLIAGCLIWLTVDAAYSDERGNQKAFIEASEFRLVDADGRIRARLTIHPGEKVDPQFEDKPGLYLYHENGSVAGSFIMEDKRGALYIRGDDGNLSVALGVSKRQNNGHQGGFLTLVDTDQKGANMGVWADYEKGMSAASSLRLFSGPRRKVIWETK